MTRARPLVILAIVAVFVCVSAAAVLGSKSASGGPARTYTVTLTDRGFQPASLAIRTGDTVRFVTAQTEPFWPASDPHPTHTLFPAFDPRRAIAAGDSWSFTFEQGGIFGYHDHLAPAYTGTISVASATSTATGSDTCAKDPHTETCWRATLLSTVERDGPKAALKELATLYRTEPNFPGACHSLAHDIGVASWQHYLANPDSIITPDAAACGNGFYHGFMEAFLTSTRDPAKAKAFCTFIGQKLGDEAPDAELQCYHGIGHGAMDFAIGSATLANASSSAETLVNPALTLCRSVSSDDKQLYRCASAVFNSLANLYLSTTTRAEFNLSYDPHDPLKICGEYPAYADSCNGNMNSLLYNMSGRNFSRAVSAIESIVGDAQAESAMVYLAAISIDGDSGKNPAGATAVCRTVQNRLHTPCIVGLAHGFLENGQPGKEGDEALAFCALPTLSTSERSTCYQYVLSTLLGWFSPEESKRLCASAPVQYQNSCPVSVQP